MNYTKHLRSLRIQTFSFLSFFVSGLVLRLGICEFDELADALSAAQRFTQVDSVSVNGASRQQQSLT